MTPVRQQLLRAQAASEQTGKLTQCKFTAPANQLSLVPDEESVVVAGAGTLVFRVKGGTGEPRATLLGTPGKAKATVTSAGPAYLVTVDLSAAPSGAEQIILHITDGRGELERTVNIVGPSQIEDGSPTPVTNGMPPTENDSSMALTSNTAAKMCSKLGLETGCYKPPEPPPLTACRTALGQRGPLKEQDALSIIDTSRAECKPK